MMTLRDLENHAQIMPKSRKARRKARNQITLACLYKAARDFDFAARDLQPVTR